jgi:hypothetical protein
MVPDAPHSMKVKAERKAKAAAELKRRQEVDQTE